MSSELPGFRSETEIAATRRPSDMPGESPSVNGTHAQPVPVHRDEWFDYWESLEPSSRLFEEQSAAYVEKLCNVVRLTSELTVLDYGCGFGYVTSQVAELAGQVYAWDRSPGMRSRTMHRTAHQKNVVVLERNDPGAAVSDITVDVVLINSVVQYMSHDDFKSCLLTCSDALSQEGIILVSDMVPEEYNGLRDVADLLRFSMRRGIFLETVLQGIKDAGDYIAHRQARELTRHDQEWLRTAAAECGLTAGFVASNLTHFPRRITAAFKNPESQPWYLSQDVRFRSSNAQ